MGPGISCLMVGIFSYEKGILLDLLKLLVSYNDNSFLDGSLISAQEVDKKINQKKVNWGKTNRDDQNNCFKNKKSLEQSSKSGNIFLYKFLLQFQIKF
jgi:hypothetical protein